MIITDKGITIVQQCEGVRYEAYEDKLTSPPLWTIGYGHTSGVKSGQRTDDAGATTFLRGDMVTAENIVNNLNLGLNQNQFDACVSFAFNTGYLKRSPKSSEDTFIYSLIKSGKWTYGESDDPIQDIRAAFVFTARKSGGNVQRGLVKRRLTEAKLFATGDGTVYSENDPLVTEWMKKTYPATQDAVTSVPLTGQTTDQDYSDSSLYTVAQYTPDTFFGITSPGAIPDSTPSTASNYDGGVTQDEEVFSRDPSPDSTLQPGLVAVEDDVYGAYIPPGEVVSTSSAASMMPSSTGNTSTSTPSGQGTSTPKYQGGFGWRDVNFPVGKIFTFMSGIGKSKNPSGTRTKIFLHHTAGWGNPYATVDGFASRDDGVVTDWILGGRTKNSTSVFKDSSGKFIYDGLMLRTYDATQNWAYHSSCGKLHPFVTAVEICNMGQLERRSGKFYIAGTNTVWTHEDEVVETAPHRGYKYWQRITDAQMESLEKWIRWTCQQYGVRLAKVRYDADWFAGNSGPRKDEIKNMLYNSALGSIHVHTHTHPNKTDLPPDPRLIQMLNDLA